MAEALATEAPAIELAISEPLTWDEICERYPDQWVVLVELDWPDEDHNAGFRTARVAGVGRTRREAFDRGRPFERGYPGCANRFTGPIARSIAHLLRCSAAGLILVEEIPAELLL